jgi:hypothetical protein
MQENIENGLVVIEEETSIAAPTTPTESESSGWDRARYWVEISQQFESRQLIAQIMAGFELLALHDEQGIKQGTNNLSHGEKGLFKAFMESRLNVSSAAAYRWMGMAKKLSGVTGKGPDAAKVREVLDRPIKDWSKENTDLIFHYVEKLTAGKRQKELLAAEQKRQQASKANTSPEGKLARQQEYKGGLVKARREWEEVHKHLQTYGDQFTILPDTIIIEQVKALEVMMAARVLWTKYPTDLRTLETADDIFRRAVVQIEIDREKRIGKK